MGLKHQRTWGMKQERNISRYCSMVKHVQQHLVNMTCSMNSLAIDKLGNRLNEHGFRKVMNKKRAIVEH